MLIDIGTRGIAAEAAADHWAKGCQGPGLHGLPEPVARAGVTNSAVHSLHHARPILHEIATHLEELTARAVSADHPSPGWLIIKHPRQLLLKFGNPPTKCGRRFILAGHVAEGVRPPQRGHAGRGAAIVWRGEEDRAIWIAAAAGAGTERLDQRPITDREHILTGRYDGLVLDNACCFCNGYGLVEVAEHP